MKLLKEIIALILKEHEKLRRLYKAATVLACIVVFVTTYVLMLPAITLDKKAASQQSGLRLGPSGSSVIRMAADTGPEEDDQTLDAQLPADENASAGGAEETAVSTPEIAEDSSGDTGPATGADGGSGEGSGDETSTDTESDDAAAAASEGAAVSEPPDASDTSDTALAEENADAAAAAATAQSALPEEELITEETELTARGDGFKVYVTVTTESMLPKATEVSVREITKDRDEKEFALYYKKAQKDLRDKYDESVSLSFARFYDISFMYKGSRIEPASKVKVRFEFDEDREPEVPGMARVDMIHFNDSGSDRNAEKAMEEPERSEFIESEWKMDGDEKIMTGAGGDLGSQKPFEDEDIYVREGAVSRGGVSSDSAGSAKSRRSMKAARRSSSENAEDVRGLREFEFGSDDFSVYGVLGTVIEKYIIASDGNSYKISVTYGAEAQVPEGSELGAVEIIAPEGEEGSSDGESADTSLYGEYVSRIEETMGWEAGSASHVRLFDIRIQDPEGEKVQIQAPVDVKIELMDGGNGIDLSGEDTRIIHFADGSDTGDVIDDFEVDGDTISFRADGFSAYAIVEGPAPADVPAKKVASVDELAQNYDYGKGFYLSYGNNTYFKNKVKRNGTNVVYEETAAGDVSSASEWFFESAGDNKYYIYTYTDSGKQYMYNNTAKNANNMDLSADSRTAFVVSRAADGKFYLQADGQNRWLQHSNGGGGIRLYTDHNNAANSQIMITYVPEEAGDDPYGLDGMTYGLMNWNGGAAGKALMSSSSVENKLDARQLTCMTNSEDDKDKLFVPSSSDISMWTFENESLDNYYLKTVVDSSTMYLKISPSGISLTEDKEEAGTVQVIPGTGVHAGEISLKANGAVLTYSGDINQGFGVDGSAGSEYLYLTEESTLTEDYFRTYSAQKVSVSDPGITDGSKIIVYTRSWNDKKKRYELYAVKGDGTLVPCYESGDSIEWVGGQFNELLWDFVEYDEAGTPTYFYELYNEYSEKFIAPQVTDGQITSDDPTGINLTGRRDGKYYSSVLAWDDAHYAYAGLKVENGKIVSCPKSEAMDFYFAVMEDLPVDDKIHTVSTVDNNQHGITMKMIDKENDKTINGQMNAILGSKEGGAGSVLQQGLLADHLDENGYPTVTKTGGSLAEMYAGDQTVNHLFIESTYNATGYFEFDSSQNFAHLNGENFDVYKELGSQDESSKPSLKHGQFYPYNVIEPGLFAVINGKNQYDATGHELPDGDPRKNEQLYLTKKPDYYFAMELEAGFIQTPSGLDEWGHDIIYEFTGDDDFWLYVDGELVIDLGGIHSAVPGSVNFRTGDVNVNGKSTTLYDIFKKHYQDRGVEDVQAELDKIFQVKNVDGRTCHIFKDNTSHTMKIFYMERGASASNLHMRFNLASIKPGTFILGKELSGVNAEETVLAEFGYQIRYRVKNKETGQVKENLLTNEAPDYNVIYKGTTQGVTFNDEFKVHDGEAGDIIYENVFILKPGELAEVSFPLRPNEELVDYKVTECGLNASVYDDVSVNGTSIEGTEIEGHPGREDYSVGYDTTVNRAKVAYVNEVNPDALRTVTINKRLFCEDGETPIHYDKDQTAFNFRLYLGTESDEELTLANMHIYHVKDPDGHYCTWNVGTQKFESTPYTNYADVPDDMKTAVSFNTSMNGTISKIPVDHTVELRELLVGTQYRVEERAGEIPDGYSFRNYKWRNTDSASVVDSRNGVGVNDTIAVGKDPDIDVCNLKGWGLRLNKVWSDADYMSDRDPAYFAVFTEDEATGELTLVDGTVRELKYAAKPQSLYWYFQRLPDKNIGFDNYVMREVTLNGHIVVDGNGVVTNYNQLRIIDNGGEVDIKGIQKGEKRKEKFTYTVTYDKGIPDATANLRVDTVTNNRPGIELRKEDWDGNSLAGCTFTLTDDEGLEIGTFASDEEGLISVAFLRDKVEYTLTETMTPRGYRGLSAPMTILLKNGTVSVSGVDEEYYDLQQGAGTTPTLTIKNRPYTFRAVKVSGEDESPLPGVHFSLHRQITVDGQTSYDIYPMSGYEDIVSDDEGYLTGIDTSLREGTFELQESEVPEGFQQLPSHVHFSKTQTGLISLVDPNPEEVTLSEEALADGTIEYVLKIRNDRSKKVSFSKVDVADPHQIVLPGAAFDLYRVVEGEEVEPALYTGLVSGADGLLKDSSGNTVFPLDSGTYHLVETQAPQGYVKREEPIVVEVGGPTNVSYDDGTGFPLNPGSVVLDEESGVYTLLITNSSGAVLPESGGPGTGMLRAVGLVMTAGAVLALVWLKGGFRAGRKRLK